MCKFELVHITPNFDIYQTQLLPLTTPILEHPFDGKSSKRNILTTPQRF